MCEETRKHGFEREDWEAIPSSTPTGMAVVTSNFPIFHTNVGSWLHRRQIMIPFDHQCAKHKKRDLMKDFEPELGALTSYLLNIPSEKIEAVLKGLGSSNLNSTVWESQMRSDGLAAWLNDWVVEDSTARVRIGSNAREWAREEDYDAERSTLYGSYALYCQQSNRSAKSPQNFSAELLELSKRILGWNTEKGRVKMCGKTVRVIKGLRLRTNFDEEPTIEEFLESDNEGDIKVDNGSDSQDDNQDDNQENNLKAPSNNESNDSDASQPITQEVEIKIDNTSKNVETVPQKTEVQKPKPSPIDWLSYPYQSRDRYTLENRANKVKERALGCGTNNELIALYADGKVSELEINWIKGNLLSESELAQLVIIESTKQGNLFDQEKPEVVIEWEQIKNEIDALMKQLGWSQQRGKDYLIKRYGKSSRLHLTDEQLIEFWNYLKNLK